MRYWPCVRLELAAQCAPVVVATSLEGPYGQLVELLVAFAVEVVAVGVAVAVEVVVVVVDALSCGWVEVVGRGVWVGTSLVRTWRVEPSGHVESCAACCTLDAAGVE